MFQGSACFGGDHQAPRGGGSCACGMVTRIPAARGAARPDVRDLLVRCLHDGPGDATAIPVLRQRADRLLAAFAEAGLTLGPGEGTRLPA